MRVLWLVRDDLCTHPGGDTTQILKTAQALVELGVSVDFAGRPPHSTSSYDLVHLFHLDRLWEHLPVCRQLRRARSAAVLSTIYWPADDFDRGGRAGFQGFLARLLGSERYQAARLTQRFFMRRSGGGLLRGWDRRLLNFCAAARYLLETVRVILPNSRAEQEVIAERFGVRPPAVIVPNAADGATFGGPYPPVASRSGVLCVGRLEPRKNQLALIEALADSEVSLTLVGQSGRFSGRYAARCRAAGGANVRYVGQCDQAELRTLYHGARVHACVSWYETPGLASLEAGLCGCRLVVTPGGCTREYFGVDAYYCQPDDPESIREAIEAALAAETPTALAERISSEFTWSAAARATLAGYETALGARDGGG